jgi:hypothetical protein
VSKEMKHLVTIYRAANPDIAGASFEEFQDEHEVFGIVYTSKVCEVLGLTRKFGGGWEAMPKLYELLAVHATRQHDDIVAAESTQTKGFDDPDLLRSILATAGLEEGDGYCAFTCNVLKVLGLVVAGPSNNSWKPTPGLRNLMMGRLVRPLNVRASHPEVAEVDD